MRWNLDAIKHGSDDPDRFLHADATVACMSGTVSLLVPTNVTALCVGPLDQQSRMKFAAIAPDFQSLATHPYLGSSIVPRPFSEETAPAGIHLHWALPDALTQSDPTKSEGIRVVPNRFLVVRMAVTDESPAKFESKAWVVESDYIWKQEDSGVREADPRNAVSRSVPLVYADKRDTFHEPSFAYQGRVRPLDGHWADERSRLRHPPFTALGYGTEAYAAAYPHCRNVFGFFDPCFDSGAATDGLAPRHRYLSYLVIGWFSDAASDPINLSQQKARELFVAELKRTGTGLSDIADLEAEALAKTIAADYRWAYKARDEGNVPGVRVMNRPVRARRPERTLFVGQLTQIEWNPNRACSTRQDEPISVAMGMTMAEALSAMLASTQGNSSGVETLLSDFQFDLLPEYATAAGQAGLPDARHLREFSPVSPGNATAKDSGRVWAVKRADAEPPGESPSRAGSEDQVEGNGVGLKLPADLGRALHALNRAQAEFDTLTAALAARQGQLFADWTNCLTTEDASARRYIEQEILALEGLARDVMAQQAARDLAKAELEGLLGPPSDSTSSNDESGSPALKYALQSLAAPRFYQSNDPVILLSGVTPSARYGGDGRFDPANLLVCRVSDEITAPKDLRSLPSDQRAILDAACARAHWSAVIGRALPQAEDLVSLCVEACLLNPWLGKYIGGPELVRWQQDYLRGDQENFKGVAPSPVGLMAYEQPWIPLILQWETTFRPFRPVCLPGEVPAAYPALWCVQDFELSNADPEIIFIGPRLGVSDPGSTCYQGTVTLTHNVQFGLTGRIERYLNDHPADRETDSTATQQLRRTLEAVGKLPFRMMAQSMDGLHKQMLMRSATLQLPVQDPPKESDRAVARWKEAYFEKFRFADRVGLAVGSERNAAALNDRTGFNPLRAGMLKITRLRLVDAFGQIRDVIGPDLRPEGAGPNRLVLPARLAAPKSWNEAAAVLPLRIAQPARLSFRFRAVGKSGGASVSAHAREMNSDAASTPIFGWILHNRFDSALAIYDEAGRPIGSFHLNGPAWQEAPGPSRGVANSRLLEFVQHLGGGWASTDRKDFQRKFLEVLIEAIDRSVSGIDIDGYAQDLGLAVLIGRPLALVQADLRLDLHGSLPGSARFGLPAIDQSLDAFKDAVAKYTAAEADGYVESVRRSAGIESVRFPVRLGDNAKVHDGLVGYFVQGDDPAQTFRTFYSPNAEVGASSPVAKPPLSGKDCLSLAAADALPTTVFMLLDPRAPIHATTGILPVKRIALPPHQYAAAAGRIDATFLVAPVLGGSSSLGLPVPAESGRAWSWLTRHADEVLFDANGAGVRKWSTQALVESPNTRAAFSAPPLRISEGWLHLYPTQLKPRGTEGKLQAMPPTPFDILIQPDARGDLSLDPETATLHGAGIAMAEVDDGRRFIGYWKDERDHVSWKVVAHGGYRVEIRYSAPLDTQFDLEVLNAQGGHLWTQIYSAKGSTWDQIRSPEVVSWREGLEWIYAVPLAWFGLDAGDYEFKIVPARRLLDPNVSEPVEKPWRPLNLWSIALSKVVVPSGPDIHLSSWFATLHGKRIRYRCIPGAMRPERTYIGDWSDKEEFVTWQVSLGLGAWQVRVDKRRIGLTDMDDADAVLSVEVRDVTHATLLASAHARLSRGVFRTHALDLATEAVGDYEIRVRLLEGSINLEQVVLDSTRVVRQAGLKLTLGAFGADLANADGGGTGIELGTDGLHYLQLSATGNAPAAYASWTVAFTDLPLGRLAVEICYATPHADASLVVEAHALNQDAVLSSAAYPCPATGGFATFRTQRFLAEVGKLTLPKAGSYQIRIRLSDPVNGAPMHVRSVTLLTPLELALG